MATSVWTQNADYVGQRDTIVLDFTFVYGDDNQPCTWSVVVRSKRYPCPAQEHLDLGVTDIASIGVTFPSGLMVSGPLYLRSLQLGWVVWSENLSYGFPGQIKQLIEGGLVALNGEDPPSPPPVPPPPVPPFPTPVPTPVPWPTPIVEPAVGREGDLFPYQYMRQWPAPSAEEIELSFIDYPPSTPVTLPATLVTVLTAIRRSGAADARDQMQRAAIAYIEGECFQGLSFSDVPFPSNAKIRLLIASVRGQEPAEVIARVWSLVGFSAEALSAELSSPGYLTLLGRAWQSYFALVIELGYDRRLRDAIAEWLIVDHLLRWLAAHGETVVTPEQLDMLLHATIVLPATIFPLPPAGAPPVMSPPTPSTEWIVPYAIGDLQMVKQKLVRYALGELAYVHSVMPGELRKSVRRSASRVVQTSSRTSIDERARDTQASSTSLTKAVKGTIEDTRTTAKYHNFSTTYGPAASDSSPTATMNGSWTLEKAPGASPSQNDVARYAKNVVDRAADRVSHQVLEARSVSSSRESEETITSVLDNTGGTSGRRGIYRWLNEVYEARVVNYGNRLVLELVIAEPAARYLRTGRSGSEDASPPVPPAALGIESFEDISRQSFPLVAARYPSEALRLPPEPSRTVSGWVRSGEPLSLSLPEGYAASLVHIGYVLPLGQRSLDIEGIVGRIGITILASSTRVMTFPMGGEEGTVQVLLQTSSPPSSPLLENEPIQLTVEIESAPSEAAMSSWRLETFQAIQAAYAAQMEAYQGSGSPGDLATPAAAPRYSYRAIERKELRRGAVDLLFRQLDDRTGGGLDAPSRWPSHVDVARPRYLQFFQRAFEWNEVSYSFIADTGASLTIGAPTRSASTFATESGDDRFLEFIEAAYAQVLLPVSPREALAVLYFLASGMLWDGGEERIPTHSSDVALVSELKKLRHAPRELRGVSEPWEVIVPTTISVLQDGSGSIADLCVVGVPLGVNQDEPSTDGA